MYIKKTVFFVGFAIILAQYDNHMSAMHMETDSSDEGSSGKMGLSAHDKLKLFESQPIQLWDFFRARNQKEQKLNISNVNNYTKTISVPDLYEKTNHTVTRYSKAPLSNQQVGICGCVSGLLSLCCTHTVLSLLETIVPIESAIPVLVTSAIASTIAGSWYAWKHGYQLREHVMEDYQSVRLPNVELYQKVSDSGTRELFYREYLPQQKEWVLTKVAE